MEERLPLTVQASIERERAQLIGQAFSVYDLLFRFDIDLALKTWPRSSPMPASLKLQIQQYTFSLFDVEAKHYGVATSNESEMRSWLLGLVVSVEADVTKMLEPYSKSHDFHCPANERLQTIRDGLNERVEHWIKAAGSDYATTMARGRATLKNFSKTMEQFHGAGQLEDLAVAPSQPKAVEIRKPPTLIKEQSVAEALDDLVLKLDISHEELASRIGLSRSVYFVVKSGKGSKRALKKMNLYLSKTSTNNQD